MEPVQRMLDPKQQFYMNNQGNYIINKASVLRVANKCNYLLFRSVQQCCIATIAEMYR